MTRSFRRTCCIIVAGCWLTAQAGASPAAGAKQSEWPQFRGANGRGVSSDVGLPVTWGEGEGVAWKTPLPGAGTSSPVIVGSRVFVTCYSGYNVPGEAGEAGRLKLHLLCLNRDDGKVLWQRDVPPKFPEQPRIREGHGYASSTPAADGERVYAFFGKSGVHAFDHAGKPLWQADVGSGLNGWGSAASPVLVGDLLIVNASVESESLVALNPRTGKEVWRAEGIKESWNTPVTVQAEGSKTELVVAIHGKVLGLEPTTGEHLWSCATDIPWYMVPTLVAGDGVVYAIGGRPGGGLAVRAGGRGDVTRTHRLWTSRKGSNVSSPVLHEGHLYWAHDNLGVVFCADAKTGNVVYEERIDRAGQVYASPVLADGKLYYVSRTGRVYVLAAKPQYELLATNTLGDRSTFNATPAVAGGRLFLRSDKFLYCIGGK